MFTLNRIWGGLRPTKRLFTYVNQDSYEEPGKVAFNLLLYLIIFVFYFEIYSVKTQNFVFRFETERVEYPETIWNLDSYS